MIPQLVRSTLLISMFTLLGACAKQGVPDMTPRLWSVSVGGFGASIVSDDLLLGYTPVPEGGGRVTAVSLTERKVLWRSDESLRFDISQIMTANDEAVFVFLNGKGLFIYDRQGQLLARVAPPDEHEAEGGGFGAAPTLLGEILFVPNGPHLYAYDVSVPSEPTLLWQRSFLRDVWSLAVDTTGIYVGVPSDVGGVFKLALEDGRDVWSLDAQKKLVEAQAFAIVDERLLAYGFNLGGSLLVFDRGTGEELWSTSLDTCSDGAGFANALEVGDGKVFISPSSGSCLFAVDLTTGKEVWTVETGEVGPDGAISIGGKPLYHNGVVYTSVERLWALDARTGRVLSFASQKAYNTTDTVIHYANGEILVWGDELTAYKPVR